MSAVYQHPHGENIDLCEIVAVSNETGELHIIRKLPLKTTDADVPDVTTWDPIDIVNTSAAKTVGFVVQSDAYENHWLEVIAPDSGGSFATIFSGLGYYL